MHPYLIGYSIIYLVFFVFIIGSVSIICDMLFNEEEVIIIKKQKNKIAPPISDDDFFDT